MFFRARSSPSDLKRIQAALTRALGMTFHPVQLQGGTSLTRGSIVEMETGEGKTLTAIIPAALAAMEGQDVLIATANDYLAQRDSRWTEPVFQELGLRVGCVLADQSRTERAAAYHCDITYGTARQFGFDFLQDHLERRRRTSEHSPVTTRGPVQVQRAPAVLIVDEADSLLIDEARTPLLISGPTGVADQAHEACYRWAARFVPSLIEGTDYLRSRDSGWPALMPFGRQRIRHERMPEEIASLSMTEIHHFIERALFVNHRYHPDQHYIVQDGEIRIVDEYTGRIQKGRKWNDGIHQAIEARESLPLTPETGHLARITMQEFVRRFPQLSGMTGTAREAAHEFRTVYGLPVKRIPTHLPSRRERYPDAVFATAEEKWDAIIHEALGAIQNGRAVLIGTPSVATSMALSERAQQAGIPHQVLNALNPEKEADIIAQAGQPQRVTIATNMAGRGTDIVLADSVREAGGLHVIATELHSAARIDRQLTGRCGRQGDPGSYRQFLSLEDEILTLAFGESRAKVLREKGLASPRPQRWIALLKKAQARIEREHLHQRWELMKQDEQLRKATQSLGLDVVLDAVE